MRTCGGERLRRAAACVLLLAGSTAGSAAFLQSQQKGGLTGDSGFHVGDQVVVSVDSEKQLSDTFTVVAGPALVLPIIGSVPLDGVKRAEVQRHLETYIRRYIREPIVHARAIVRIAVSGEVSKPGFFPVPVSAVVMEALMSAGGPTATGRLDGISIKRNGATLFSPDSLRAAIGRGVTLAELDIQSADEIVVPKARDIERTVRIVGYAVSVPLAIFGILRAIQVPKTATTSTASAITIVSVSPPAISIIQTATITVHALGANGQALSGAPVTFTSTGIGDTFTPASVTTGATGQATTTFSATVAGTKTITARSGTASATTTVVVSP